MSMAACFECAQCAKYYAAEPQRYGWHNMLCAWCGARLIQKIQRLRPLTPEEKRTRCRTVLADWMRYGSTEVQLRDLAKRTAWAVRPA
jgi:hypothetical protein